MKTKMVKKSQKKNPIPDRSPPGSPRTAHDVKAAGNYPTKKK